MIAISRAAGLALMLLLCAGSAQAAVEISSAPTQNMNCSAGVCSPTAKNAVLNVNDLTGMLASADVKITTGNGAVTIGIVSPLAWASTHRLTLDANLNVNIKAQVMVEGTAGLTIVPNDGGSGGDLMFYPGGKIDFWDTNSSLIINGSSYRLVGDLTTLKKAIHANAEGFYALAEDYDLHRKKFSDPPIHEFLGTFEGLGNSILNLDIEGPVRHNSCEGMFGYTGKYDIQARATIRDINLKEVHIFAPRTGIEPYVGALVGCNYGYIINASVDGTIDTEYTGVVGGLVGENESGGLISRSRSAASVTGPAGGAGGLAGSSIGIISQSYAVGNVTAAVAGGLIGDAGGGPITNCYAVGTVTAIGDFWAGGFIGATSAKISSSYSVGAVGGGSGWIGGFAGYHNRRGRGNGFSAAYWDLDTSGISNPAQGCGNREKSCAGLTGLTDAQLKSGLPAGFDPSIWTQSASINNGYPYLLANPPSQ